MRRARAGSTCVTGDRDGGCRCQDARAWRSRLRRLSLRNRCGLAKSKTTNSRDLRLAQVHPESSRIVHNASSPRASRRRGWRTLDDGRAIVAAIEASARNRSIHRCGPLFARPALPSADTPSGAVEYRIHILAGKADRAVLPISRLQIMSDLVAERPRLRGSPRSSVRQHADRARWRSAQHRQRAVCDSNVVAEQPEPPRADRVAIVPAACLMLRSKTGTDCDQLKVAADGVRQSRAAWLRFGAFRHLCGSARSWRSPLGG